MGLSIMIVILYRRWASAPCGGSGGVAISSEGTSTLAWEEPSCEDPKWEGPTSYPCCLGGMMQGCDTVKYQSKYPSTHYAGSWTPIIESPMTRAELMMLPQSQLSIPSYGIVGTDCGMSCTYPYWGRYLSGKCLATNSSHRR